jgi:RimJ/RimL family protein N-acetyltransferase
MKIVLGAEPLVDGPTALRPWRDSDMDAIIAICQDPEIVRWTSVPERYGEVDARNYLMQRYDSLHAGVTAPYAIVSASDLDHVIGSISLVRLAWKHLRGEVGYWLAPEARGHGHATRAVRLICAWGFESLGLERIDLFAATGNPASQHVAERAGFVREGVLRSFMRGKDGYLDMVAFGLLADHQRRPDVA